MISVNTIANEPSTMHKKRNFNSISKRYIRNTNSYHVLKARTNVDNCRGMSTTINLGISTSKWTKLQKNKQVANELKNFRARRLNELLHTRSTLRVYNDAKKTKL